MFTFLSTGSETSGARGLRGLARQTLNANWQNAEPLALPNQESGFLHPDTPTLRGPDDSEGSSLVHLAEGGGAWVLTMERRTPAAPCLCQPQSYQSSRHLGLRHHFLP